MAKFFEGKFRRAKLKTKNTTSKPGRVCANKIMNNPNPFVPKGSLLEQQSQRRSRLKLAVFCVLAVSVTGLVAMLIQGCKRENPDAQLNLPPVVDTSSNTPPPVMDLSIESAAADAAEQHGFSAAAGAATPVLPPPPAVETAGSEYVIVAGDTLAKIAKAHGVPLQGARSGESRRGSEKIEDQAEARHPGVTKSADVAPAATAGAADAGGEAYTVKSGDTLDQDRQETRHQRQGARRRRTI